MFFLLNTKYSKSSNILKYYYILKCLFSILVDFSHIMLQKSF